MVRLTSVVPMQSSGEATPVPSLDWLAGDIEDLRSNYALLRDRPVPSDAAWIAIEAAGRQVRVLAHRATGPADAAIVYFHGGGFIVGSPLTHVDLTDALRRESGLSVYSVDYRLAPDAIAPAPADDGLVVVEHLVQSGIEKIILCGDSAGGAIALSLEARLPPHHRAFVVGVCSLYGAHGDPPGHSVATRGSREDGTDAECIRRYFTLANGGTGNAYSVAAIARPSPVPVYLLAAAEDAFLDDSLTMAKQLAAFDRSVILDIVPGVGHGFLHDGGRSETALNALRSIADWCRKLISGERNA